MPRKLVWAAVSILIICGASSSSADTQLHGRFGPMAGTYWGPQTGDFATPSTFDIEYQWFQSNQRALALRTILAVELVSSKVFYLYAGAGYRYYFGSKGMLVDTEERGISISVVPKWRYYWGWDAGIAQVLVNSLGRVLSIVSTMVDVGLCGGVIYQIDKNLGAELHLGATTGQGFSQISVIGTSLRTFAGLTYYF